MTKNWYIGSTKLVSSSFEKKNWAKILVTASLQKGANLGGFRLLWSFSQKHLKSYQGLGKLTLGVEIWYKHTTIYAL
jgi:hypothetical protein